MTLIGPKTEPTHPTPWTTQGELIYDANLSLVTDAPSAEAAKAIAEAVNEKYGQPKETLVDVTKLPGEARAPRVFMGEPGAPVGTRVKDRDGDILEKVSDKEWVYRTMYGRVSENEPSDTWDELGAGGYLPYVEVID